MLGYRFRNVTEEYIYGMVQNTMLKRNPPEMNVALKIDKNKNFVINLFESFLKLRLHCKFWTFRAQNLAPNGKL